MKISHRMLAILAATLTSGSALAADVSVGYTPVPDVIAYDSAPIWTGFYAGVHAGFGLLDTQDTLGLGGNNMRTPLGGVHAGYNHQFGSFVFGLEADATAVNVDSNPDAPNADLTVNWMGSVRARVGYAFDQVMFYGTGGFSMARAEVSSNVDSSRQTQDHTGYVLGAGVEFMVSDNWALGAEYLRHEFSEETYVLNNTFDSDGNFDAFRLRVSYAF